MFIDDIMLHVVVWWFLLSPLQRPSKVTHNSFHHLDTGMLLNFPYQQFSWLW